MTRCMAIMWRLKARLWIGTGSRRRRPMPVCGPWPRLGPARCGRPWWGPVGALEVPGDPDPDEWAVGECVVLPVAPCPGRWVGSRACRRQRRRAPGWAMVALGVQDAPLTVITPCDTAVALCARRVADGSGRRADVVTATGVPGAPRVRQPAPAQGLQRPFLPAYDDCSASGHDGRLRHGRRSAHRLLRAGPQPARRDEGRAGHDVLVGEPRPAAVPVRGRRGGLRGGGGRGAAGGEARRTDRGGDRRPASGWRRRRSTPSCRPRPG